MPDQTFKFALLYFRIDCGGQMRKIGDGDELDDLLSEVKRANLALSVSEHDSILIRAGFLMRCLRMVDPALAQRVQQTVIPPVLDFYSGANEIMSGDLADLASSMRTTPQLLFAMFMADGLRASSQLRGGLDPMSLRAEHREASADAVKELIGALSELIRLGRLKDGVFFHPFARLAILSTRLHGAVEAFDYRRDQVLRDAGFSVKSAQHKPLTRRNRQVLRHVLLTRFLRRKWDFDDVKWGFKHKPSEEDKQALRQAVSAELIALHQSAAKYVEDLATVEVIRYV